MNNDKYLKQSSPVFSPPRLTSVSIRNFFILGNLWSARKNDTFRNFCCFNYYFCKLFGKLGKTVQSERKRVGLYEKKHEGCLHRTRFR